MSECRCIAVAAILRRFVQFYGVKCHLSVFVAFYASLAHSRRLHGAAASAASSRCMNAQHCRVMVYRPLNYTLLILSLPISVFVFNPFSTALITAPGTVGWIHGLLNKAVVDRRLRPRRCHLRCFFKRLYIRFTKVVAA